MPSKKRNGLNYTFTKRHAKRPASQDRRRCKTKKSLDKDELSPVIRTKQLSYSDNVDKEVRKKLEILKRCTLRPIVIYYEPDDATIPSIKWRLHPTKDNQPLPIMYSKLFLLMCPPVIYYEPDDAAIPSIKWRLHPTKDNQPLPIMYLHRQNHYFIGRNYDVCDIHLRHYSCSNQHAVLQYRKVKGAVRPFMMDLKSMNGTKVNGVTVQPLCYVELRDKDIIEFGFSTRKYKLSYKRSQSSMSK